MTFGRCTKSNRNCEENTSITGGVLLRILELVVRSMLLFPQSPPMQLLLMEKIGESHSFSGCFLNMGKKKLTFAIRSADYTIVWNTLDYPGLVFPVTTVNPELDPPKPAHDFLSEYDKENYELCKEFVF